MKQTVWVAALIGVLALSACGGGAQGDSASAVPVAGQTGNSPETPEACPQAPAPAAGPYTATSERMVEKEIGAPKNVEVSLPQLTGGAAAVRDRFNTAMRTSLTEAPGWADGSTLHDARLRCGESSRVTRVGAHVVAGVLITEHMWDGAPHPVNQVGTVVIDTGDAQPVLLPATLRDPDRSWNSLAAVAQSLAPANGPNLFGSRNPGSDDFANWAPSPAGVTFYFYVPHAWGDVYPVFVPWSRIQDLFNPSDLATLTS